MIRKHLRCLRTRSELCILPPSLVQLLNEMMFLHMAPTEKFKCIQLGAREPFFVSPSLLLYRYAPPSCRALLFEAPLGAEICHVHFEGRKVPPAPLQYLKKNIMSNL